MRFRCRIKIFIELVERMSGQQRAILIAGSTEFKEAEIKMFERLVKGFLLLAASIAVFTPASLIAQSAVSGSISGTVSDPSGAVIQKATVTITNTDRGQDIRTLSTNSAGFYTAGSLPLGTYTVRVAAPGFKTDAVTGLVLHANDALTVNRTLTAGGTNETVTVTAAEAQINLESASSEGLI